jgi:hypothetical protein
MNPLDTTITGKDMLIAGAIALVIILAVKIIIDWWD